MRQNTIALIIALGLAGPAFAAPAATETWAGNKEPGYAKSAGICKKLKDVKLPALAPAEKSTAACDAETLYYGIGRPVDLAAARLCALNHIAANADAQNDPYDGWALLTTIYANGKGVPRDLDIATAFACRIDGAPAEMDGRILDLAKMKTAAKPADFDICTDATSGVLIGQCAAHEDALANMKREATYKRMEADMSAPQKLAFAALRKAEEAYVQAVGDNEVDMSGTLRTSMVLDAQAAQRNAFMTTLTAVLKGDAPAGNSPDFRVADAALNAAYVTIMRTKEPQWGTVDKNGIKTAQKAWLAYRDAFVAFAKVAAPNVSLDRLKAVLTRERTVQLDNFTG